VTVAAVPRAFVIVYRSTGWPAAVVPKARRSTRERGVRERGVAAGGQEHGRDAEGGAEHPGRI